MAGKYEINKEEMFRKIMPTAAQGQEEAAAEPSSGEPPTSVGGTMSEAAIAAAFAAAHGSPEPEPAPAPPSETEPASGGTMSEDAIAAAFAAAQGSAEPEPVPAPPPEPEHPVEFESEAAEEPAQEYAAELEPQPADLPKGNGFMSEDAIAAAFAAGPPPAPVNLVEALVSKYYLIYRERLDGCTCQRCQDDVSGITLNNVAPRYVTSDMMEGMELSRREMVTETVTALIKALFIVKRNPHHGEQPPMRQ